MAESAGWWTSTSKRVTRRLGGGQRSPVTLWVLVVWWAGAVVLVPYYAHVGRQPRMQRSSRGHRHPCAAMGGFPPSHRVGDKRKWERTKGPCWMCRHGVGLCVCGCWKDGLASRIPDPEVRPPAPFSSHPGRISVLLQKVHAAAAAGVCTCTYLCSLGRPRSSLDAGLDYI